MQDVLKADWKLVRFGEKILRQRDRLPVNPTN